MAEQAPPPAAATTEADRTARIGAATAGASGVLLVISLFLNWYVAPAEDLIQRGGEILDEIGGAIGIEIGDQVGDTIHLTGWEAFEITDILCVAAAFVAIVRALVAIFGESDNPAIPGNVLTAALGGVALALILYRTVNPPYVGLEREIGLWLALFAAGGIVYGSYVAVRAERS
ncbi:MAG: hypothetical protein FJW90_08855 [Actinobacteria bacterium]|nr:hypothetical protein [Actinomycetota bacterium]